MFVVDYHLVTFQLWKYTIVGIILSNMCTDPRFVDAVSATDECQVTPVIHVLQYPGCVPKPIPSFACIGRCASYIQVRYTGLFWGIRKSAKIVICRCLAVRFGRWKDRVCVVRSRVKGRRRSRYFVQNQSQENENSSRFVHFSKQRLESKNDIKFVLPLTVLSLEGILYVK